MPITFSEFTLIKASAAGNDFLIADIIRDERRQIWQRDWPSSSRAELTRLWCDRHEGLGADGLVILESDPGADFKWDFYNSDGGSAEMCGNAARAVAYYVQQSTGKSQMKFLTRAGLVNARVHSAAKVEVELPAVKEAEWTQSTRTKIAFDFVRAGVPHAVVRVDDITDREMLRKIAFEVKNEFRFRDQGTNVTFVHAATPEARRIDSVTFERGVEDFTLACGTGAVAAAYTIARGDENKEIEVQVPGGLLSVIWKNGRPLLTGPAKIAGTIRPHLP